MAERLQLEGTPREIQNIFSDYLNIIKDPRSGVFCFQPKYDLEIATDLTLAQVISDKNVDSILAIFSQFREDERLVLRPDVAAKLTLATAIKDSKTHSQEVE